MLVTASCGARGPLRAGTSPEVVRARRPVPESITQVGSSATSSGTSAARVSEPSDSSKIVRRGVPYSRATSAISSLTTASSRSREARISSSSRIFSSSSLLRASSSICEYFVNRRNRSSRMYSACCSERSKTAMRRSLACGVSSDERITAITSSILRTAISRPSVRWRSSRALPRRCSLRRRTTSRR